MTKTMKYDDTIRASYLGYVTQAIINNFAPLLFLIFRNALGIPMEKITILITVNFVVQFIVDLWAIKYIDRIGYRLSIVTAHIFAGIGLLGLAVFPSIFTNKFGGLLAAVVLYAVGGGLIEVLISPIVEACPTDNKSSSMSLLHSFYCWGMVFVIIASTLFLRAFGEGSWKVLAVVWAIFPLANAFYFAKVPIALLTAAGESTPLRSLFSLKTFWLFVVLMISAGAAEQAMIQWASAFAESGLQISKTVGDLLGPCMFAVLMGISRVFYAKFSERIDLLKFIIGSGVLCIFSYLLVVFSTYPLLSLIGCALCGLSVGILWPGIISLAAGKFPKGGTAVFAILALAGDIGCAAGPTIVGTVSSMYQDNLKYGFIAAIVFPVLLVFGTGLYQWKLKNQRMIMETREHI